MMRLTKLRVLRFVFVCAVGAGAAFAHHESVRIELCSYVNTVFITRSSPHCRPRIGAYENLLALDVRPLGSSKSEKG